MPPLGVSASLSRETAISPHPTPWYEMHVHSFLHSFMQTALHLHDLGSKIANARR